MKISTVLYSILALFAFAGNSVLCRLALASEAIDPSSFTVIRIVSGAVTLSVLVLIKHFLSKLGSAKLLDAKRLLNEGWVAPLMLFAYAALFSFAYVSLDTGVGALILFGAVQICLLLAGLLKGERFSALELLGLGLACVGLLYLVYPELSKPSLVGFLMMALAGIAWGIYTIKGQGSTDPLSDTNSNFIKAVPMALVLLLVTLFAHSGSMNTFGVVMAMASGALTSGVGYAIWYAALPNLSTSQAGVMQLLVPIIASLGGVLFAGELITQELIVASALILGGILMVILAKKHRHKFS